MVFFYRLIGLCIASVMIVGSLFTSTAYAAGSADLISSIDGPATAYNGDTFTYVVTLKNNGPDNADSAVFEDILPAGSTFVTATCTSATNGAVCPTLGVSDSSISGALLTFPNQGEIKITIDGRFIVNSPTSLPNTLTITPPVGVSEIDSSTNTSQINTLIIPQTDLSTKIVSSAASSTLGAPITYVITHTNNGTGAADGSSVHALLGDTFESTSSLYDHQLGYTISSISCTSTGGATCPVTNNQTMANSGYLDYGNDIIYNWYGYGGLYDAPVPYWPKNSSVVYTVTVTPTTWITPPCSNDASPRQIGVRAGHRIAPFVTDVDGSNNSDVSLTNLPKPVDCPILDIAVTNNTVSNPNLTIGTSITYTITYANNGPITVSGAGLNAGFIWSPLVTYTGMTVSCSASGGVDCPTLIQPASSGTQLTTPYSVNPVGPWPSGATLTYTTTFTPTDMPCTVQGGITYRGSVGLPAYHIDSNTSNNFLDRGVTLVSPPCTDLAATVSTTATGLVYGQPITYTFTHTNNGPGNASGSYIRSNFGYYNAVSYENLTLSCTSSGSVACPTVPSFASSGSSLAALYGSTVGSWGSGETLIYTVTFTPTKLNTPICSATTGTFYPFRATTQSILVMSGQTIEGIDQGYMYDPNTGQYNWDVYNNDPIGGNNYQEIDRPHPESPLCPRADLSTNVIASSTVLSNGVPFTYVITHTNNGPDDASGSSIGDRFYTDISINIRDYTISCTASGGAVCPVSLWNGSNNDEQDWGGNYDHADFMSTGGVFLATWSLYPGNLEQGNPLYHAIVPTWPTGGSLTYTISFTPIVPTDCLGAPRTVSFIDNAYSHFIPPTGSTAVDPVSSNNQNYKAGTWTYDFRCMDLVAKKVVSNSSPPPSTPMSFTLEYSNSGPRESYSGSVRDILPAGFIYSSGSCTPSGGATCGTVIYNTGSSTFTSTIPYLPYLGKATYTLYGTSIGYSSSWNNITTITNTGTERELNATTNASSVNFSVIGDDPVVRKIAMTGTGYPGGTLQYRILVNNPTTGAELQNLTIRDLLGSGMTLDTVDTITLGGGATRVSLLDPTSGDVDVNWGNFTLPPGGSLQILMTVRIPTNLPCGAFVYDNSARIDYLSLATGNGTRLYDGTLTGNNGENIVVVCHPINAYDDIRSIVYGNTATLPLLSNDTFSGVTASTGTVSVTLTGATTLTGVTIDSDGNLIVPSSTLPGTYTVPYEICEISQPMNCSNAIATITVSVPGVTPILALSDSGTFNQGYDRTLNILTNDTLSGVTVNTGIVTVTLTGTITPSGTQNIPDFTIDTDTGLLQIPGNGTEAGVYTIPYEICEIAQPTNCSTTEVVITISPLPTITLVKTVTNDNTGTMLPTQFPLSWSADESTIFSYETAQNDDGFQGNTPLNETDTMDDQDVIHVSVFPGTYTLSEGNDPGYIAGIYSCVIRNTVLSGGVFIPTEPSTVLISNTVTLTYGQDAVCTIHNDDIGPYVVVPISALPDSGTFNESSGGTLPLLSNDTLSGVTVSTGTVTTTLTGVISFTSTGGVTTTGSSIQNPPTFTLDPNTGELIIPTTTPPGTYTVPYQICEVVYPINCSTATVTITITPAPIIVVPPTGTGTTSTGTNNPPIVYLSGSTTLTINQGSGYTDPGAYWTDIEDGSGHTLSGTLIGLTASTGSFQSSGSVNTNLPGTYTIIYTYTDKDGNPGNTVTRTVIVVAPIVPPTNTGSTNTGTTNTGSTNTGTTTQTNGGGGGGYTASVIPTVPTPPVAPTIPVPPTISYPVTPLFSVPPPQRIGDRCEGEVKNLDDRKLIAYYPTLGLSDQHTSERRVSRAEFITLLLKAADVDVSGKQIDNPYADLPVRGASNPYILKATEYGLVSGSVKNGKNMFRPRDTISRAEIAKILVQAASIGLSTKITTFQDIGRSSTLKSYIQTAYDNCILHGRHTIDGVSTLPDGRRLFEPADGMTIAETIKVLYNLTER